jgi:hypothetical protein
MENGQRVPEREYGSRLIFKLDSMTRSKKSKFNEKVKKVKFCDTEQNKAGSMVMLA